MTPPGRAGRVAGANHEEEVALGPKWRRRLGFGALAVLAAGVVTTAIVLSVMFPSKTSLAWPTPPPAEHAYATQARHRVVGLIDALDALTFAADPREALAEIRRYRYLRDSPYLPGDRLAAQRVFSVAAGRVLLDEALSGVAHANSVYEGRYALYLPSGDRVTLRRDLPAGAVLSFGALAMPDFADVRTCPVELTVTATVDGADRTLATLSLDREPFAWHDHDLPIPGAASALTLAVDAPADCGARGHVFLADPAVFAPATDPPINLLYINVCTWRADDLGARDATPVMSALAERGHRFTNARANANWSKASQISALVGRYASTVGLKHFRVPVSEFERASFGHAGWPTLASTLRARGYETASFVDNIFLADYLRVGVDLGFARFVDNARHITNTVDLVGDAVDWLAARGDRPFFLYLNLANPHFRYRPPREYLSAIGLGWSDVTGGLEAALHVGEVAYTDEAVGVLLETLDHLGLAERTLIVLHGDHGETLEAGRDLEIKVPSAHQARETMVFPTTRYKHGWSWQETELRVPLVFARPGAIAPAVDARPVSPIDVAPTVLAQLGVPAPPTMAGRDALSGPPTAPILVEGKGFDAVVDGDEKYVRFWPGYGWWRRKATGAVSEAPELLYDLAADPGELDNLADARPDDRARLAAALDAIRPTPEPLHLIRLQGPAGAQIRGAVAVPGGALTATLRGQAPDEPLRIDGDRLEFAVTFADAPVMLAFVPRAPGPPTLTLAPAVRLVVGPHALPLLVADGAGAYQAAPELLAIGADQWPDVVDGAGLRAHWWTQRLADTGPEPWRLRSLEADVMDAMRDWGYAQ